jgi:hypothetical protein
MVVKDGLAFSAHHGVQENLPMKPANNLPCLCCNMPFEADTHNAHHQKYCTTPTCRKASKSASQSAWITKPENVNYHSGACAVMRVRNWQKAHPEYRERQRAKRGIALQDAIILQVAETMPELVELPHISQIFDSPSTPALQVFIQPESSALQDFISIQPYVIVGLISHFFNITLQDDIAGIARSLQNLGEDITNGRKSDEFFKAGNLYQSRAAGASAVQLGGSAIGAG